MTEGTLRELFEPFGTVSEVKLITDRETGQSPFSLPASERNHARNFQTAKICEGPLALILGSIAPDYPRASRSRGSAINVN